MASFGVILSHRLYLQLPLLRSPMMEIPEVLETGGLNWSVIDQIQIGR